MKDPAVADQVRARVLGLPRRFRREAANGLVARCELRVGGQSFTITVGGHGCSVTEGPASSPHAVVSIEPSTWLAIDEGRLTGGQAFLDRRLRVSGNLDLAVRLQTMFRPYRRARRAADLDQVEVRAGGLRLSCYVVGRGKPVLLLHGLGATKITWLPLIQDWPPPTGSSSPTSPGTAGPTSPGPTTRQGSTPGSFAV